MSGVSGVNLCYGCDHWDKRNEECTNPVCPFKFEMELNRTTIEARGDGGTISITWSADDVSVVRPDLSIEQAIEVLHEVRDKHNAEIGINWDVIREVAERLYPINNGGVDHDGEDF